MISLRDEPSTPGGSSLIFIVVAFHLHHQRQQMMREFLRRLPTPAEFFSDLDLDLAVGRCSPGRERSGFSAPLPLMKRGHHGAPTLMILQFVNDPTKVRFPKTRVKAFS